QRVEWELTGFSIGQKELPSAFEPIARRFNMSWRLLFSDYRPRVAVFVSKQAHCMHDLLSRHQMGEFDADFPLVISNHPDLEPIAKNYGIDYYCLPVTAETKAQQEKKAAELLAN